MLFYEKGNNSKMGDNSDKKQEGHDGPSWPCNAHLSNIALWEPDLELIKANILIKVQNDYINKADNVACLMDCEIKVKVKYGWLHSRGHAKMYACTKYHWL